MLESPLYHSHKAALTMLYRQVNSLGTQKYLDQEVVA